MEFGDKARDPRHQIGKKLEQLRLSVNTVSVRATFIVRKKKYDPRESGIKITYRPRSKELKQAEEENKDTS